MKQHKRNGVVAVAVLWAVMAWAVGTKGKADMPTLDWLGREEAVKQDKAVPLRVLRALGRTSPRPTAYLALTYGVPRLDLRRTSSRGTPYLF